MDSTSSPQVTKKVLIAEDDVFLTKMYKLNLEQEGIDVTIVKNGEDAIAAMDQEQPTLLLLDLLMPKVDGSFRRMSKLHIWAWHFCS